MPRKKPKFRVGGRVKLIKYNEIVKLVGRDECLPLLWFKCSDGYLHRITEMRLLTAKEAETER